MRPSCLLAWASVCLFEIYIHQEKSSLGQDFLLDLTLSNTHPVPKEAHTLSRTRAWQACPRRPLPPRGQGEFCSGKPKASKGQSKGRGVKSREKSQEEAQSAEGQAGQKAPNPGRGAVRKRTLRYNPSGGAEAPLAPLLPSSCSRESRGSRKRPLEDEGSTCSALPSQGRMPGLSRWGRPSGILPEGRGSPGG